MGIFFRRSDKVERNSITRPCRGLGPSSRLAGVDWNRGSAA